MKKQIMRLIGNILVTVQPEKATELTKKGMTVLINSKLTIKERLIRQALLQKVEKNQDFDSLAEYHRNYWVNQGKNVFPSIDSFEKEFLQDWAFIFDSLQERLSKESDRFKTIVEIGTGNGKVLNYLSSKFRRIDKLIGIDLSHEQTDINIENFRDNPRLEFVASDGFDWVNTHAQSHTIFVTSGGVLEYFTETRLQAFFNTLNGLGKTIFIAIEPNKIAHDFTINPNSEIYGHERAFSHNYRALFERAGFQLWHQSKKDFQEEFFFSIIGAQN